MASLSFTHFPSLLRWQSSFPFSCSLSLDQIRAHRWPNKWGLSAVSNSRMGDSLAQDPSNGGAAPPKRTSRTKKAPSRTRKKVSPDIPEENVELSNDTGIREAENVVQSVSSEDSVKAPRTARRRAASSSGRIVEEKSEKGRKLRVTKKKDDGMAHQGGDEEPSNHEGLAIAANLEDKSENALGIGKEDKIEKGRKQRKAKKKISDEVEHLGSENELGDHQGFVFTPIMEDGNEEDQELGKDREEDISSTSGWPPLVCCFGAAQHCFLPSGRPSNRLIDYEIHERKKDAMWVPEKFVRAPGGSAGCVAVALARLGGKVALMGKLGDDSFGQTMLYYLNAHNVQTRAVCIDNEHATAVSKMKIGERSSLKMACVKPCAEDFLLKSEINIDVLKEAKMFYFNTSSLIDENMRSTTLKAIKISKRFGAVIFYDVNLPLPLWRSPDETKMFIQQVWNLADLIEVTKQELEFLCGIKPFENFDTKDNDKFKFVHYKPEVIAPLWHENLKVLFVTNGTSKIHYYTKEHNNAILGMEDPPITPFTADMSASGDAIVAALMRMLTVQPHLITDTGYLEQAIKYAIDCGVIDQWLQARRRGFPPKEGTEEEVVPDLDGIRSITEKEFRTRGRVLVD